MPSRKSWRTPQLNDAQLLWLAALLEGDGSFVPNSNCPQICVSMTDLDTVQEVARMFNRRVRLVSRRENSLGKKQQYRVTLSGSHAVALMDRLFPLMHSRRREQIEKAVAVYNDARLIRRVR